MHAYPFLGVASVVASNCNASYSHVEFRHKYSAAHRFFNSLLSVSSGDETLRLMLDILHKNYVGARPGLHHFVSTLSLKHRIGFVFLLSISMDLASPSRGCAVIVMTSHGFPPKLLQSVIRR